MQRGSLQYLVFEVAGRRYALPAADVQELLRAVSIVALPGAPSIVEGVINLRGRTVPILDVRRRFRLPVKPLEHTDHFIVARAGDQLAALRVDRAIELVEMNSVDIEDAKCVVPGMEHGTGLARLAHDLLLIPDLHTLLTREESDTLEAKIPVFDPQPETGGRP